MQHPSRCQIPLNGKAQLALFYYRYVRAEGEGSGRLLACLDEMKSPAVT